MALGFTRESLRRGLERGLERLGDAGIEFSGRRRPDPNLVLGVWAYYRRMAAPQIRSKEMVEELERNLHIRSHHRLDLTIDKQLRRFRTRMADLETAWSRHPQTQVHFFLDAQGAVVTRTTRQ